MFIFYIRYLFAFNYVYWCPTRCPFQNSNTTGATNGAGTAYPLDQLSLHLIVSGIRVGQSLVSCVVLSTVVFLYFFYPKFAQI
jgi:hypothetical protein